MEQDKTPMSLADATELAKRLHAVMSFPAIPNDLYHAMAREMNDLFNDADRKDLIEDTPEHLRNTLLGYSGNVMALEQVAAESTLPELISQVMNHPDLPREAKTKLGDVFIEIGNEIGNWGSPEHFAAMLGIKAQKFSPKKKGKK